MEAEYYIIDDNKIIFKADLQEDNLKSTFSSLSSDQRDHLSIINFSQCLGIKKFKRLKFQTVFPNAKEIILPSSLTVLEDGQFEYLSQLERIDLPYGVINLPERLFNVCVKLKDINIPESVRQIGWICFASSGLRSITIPSSVEIIKEGAFACDNLEKVDIEEGLKIIEPDAFNAPNLKVLKLPSSIEKIGNINIGKGILDLSSCNKISEIERYFSASCIILPPSLVSCDLHLDRGAKIFLGDKLQEIKISIYDGEIYCFSSLVKSFKNIEANYSKFYFPEESLNFYSKLKEIENKQGMEIEELPVQYKFFWI